MVNRCNASGCYTNYPGHNSAAVFRLPNDPQLQVTWVKFLNRTDVHAQKNIFFYENIILRINISMTVGVEFG